jgi:long-chain acyl-CoA synthetase
MNLARMIEPHDPDKVALVSQNREITYGRLADETARMRGGLAAAGVEAGDRVAIIGGNHPSFVISYLAALGLGAIAVPLNPASPGPEIEPELAAVEPTVLVLGTARRLGWVEGIAERIPTIRTIVVAEGDPADGEVSMASLLAADPVPIVDVDPDDVAALMFTSGTAGPPKAAMLSHRNLAANIEQDLASRDHLEGDDVVYGVLPLFHIFGLNVVLGVGLTVGATIVLVQRFDPATAAESIVRRGITAVPGAPPMWVAFSDLDELPDDTFANVRYAASGASKLPVRVSERFAERFGVEISEGYGLTEASPIVTSSLGLPVRRGSVGRVLTGQELRLVGDDGSDVPVGDAGMIWVRGDNVFQGYWNDQSATDRVLVDGWLVTGDVGMVDDDGYLYLVDRAKDLIIVSGFNVFPAEVEQVLQTHPDVAECGVVGVPHPHHGEAVKAYVVVREGADIDEESLIGYALDHLARYKCPTKVLFVDELPRNAAGKLIRRELEGTILA